MRWFRSPIGGWISVLLAAILIASCGRSPSAPQAQNGDIPPDQEGIRIRGTEGQLTLPSGSRVQAADLTTVTAYGESPVTAQSPTTARLTATVNQLAAQAVMAMDRNRRIVLLATSQGDAPIQMNSQSTAEALLFLNPVVALAAADLNVTQQVLQLLRNRNLVAPVQQAVEQQLTTLGYLDPSQDPLKTALLNGWNAIYQLARSGALPAWPPGPSGASRLAPGTSKPGVRGSALTPDSEQSGVRLVEDDDQDNNEATYEMTMLNYRWRWLSLFYRPFDANGQPLQRWQVAGRLGPRDSVSIGSLVTGAIFRPSTRSLVLSIPENTSRIDFEVWGVGGRASSRPQSDLPLGYKVEPLVLDIFLGFLVPVSIWLIGGTGRLIETMCPLCTDNDQELFLLILDITALVIAGVSGAARAAIEEARISDATVEVLQQVIRVLVDTPVGARLLMYILTRMAQRGIAGLTEQMLRTMISRISPILLFTSTVELGANIGLMVASWSQSKSVEFWTATLPKNPSWYFVVTLNWSQPTDLDLYVTAPNGETAWWRQPQISVGELDRDDIDGYGPENFTLRRKLVGTYRVAVDFYRYSQETMPSNYRVHVTTRRGEQFPCRSGTLAQPGDMHVACLVTLDDDGRVTVQPWTQGAAADAGVPRDMPRKPVAPRR